MDLYVVTPSGETVASRVHAAVLICVKTAAILGAVLTLGPLKEEDYMRQGIGQHGEERSPGRHHWL
jgi:hypothetical protein